MCHTTWKDWTEALYSNWLSNINVGTLGYRKTAKEEKFKKTWSTEATDLNT
jgi:hypothetical protein